MSQTNSDASDELERVRAQLRSVETRLADVQRVARLGYWELDIRNNQGWWSDELCRIYGVASGRRDLTFEDFLERVHPEDRNVVRQASNDCITRRAPYETQYRIVRPDGEHRVIAARAEAEFDSDGNPTQAIGIEQDITEFKQLEQALIESEAKWRSICEVTRRIEAEKALRESEERLRLAVDSGGVGLWDRDIATNQMTWNGQLKAIFGLPEDTERLTLKQALGAIHPDDRAEVERAHATALENRTGCEQVFRIVRPDGEVRWIVSKGHGVYDPGGQPVCMIGAALDVTERKQAEQTLRKNYELLDRIFATTHFCLVYLDRDLNIVRVNKAYADVRGHPPEFFVGKNRFDLYPNEKLEAIFRNVVATGTPFTIHANPFQFPDHPERGVTYWDWSLHPLRNEDGCVEGLLFALLDVTERRRIEEVNAQLAAIVESSNDAIISRGPDRAILTWNAAAERLFGYTAAEVVGRNVSLLIPADQEARAAQGRMLLEAGLPVSAYDAVRLRKDGRRIDVSVTASPIKDANGKMIGASLVFRDIGERKRAEAEHAQLAAIVASSNDAIVIRGPDRTILSWNAAAERLFGWSAQEAVGQCIDLIVPRERIGQLQPFVERAARGEPVSPIETTHLRKDGARIATQVTFSPVRDKQGNVIAHSLTARDMTELKRNEEALRSYAARLRELSQRLREVEETERHAISRELHDRVGQDLSTLTLMFGRLADWLSKESPGAVRKQLEDMRGLLKSTVGNVRDVMAELRPPVLDDYGLHAALRQLATAFAKHSGISVELIGVDLQPRLPSIVETALFRISQEALNNIAKHAQAKKVEISLSEASERVVLDIADDGVGFDASETRQDRQHWGILTMRERSEAVGIAFRLKSAPGAGTRVVLEVERTAT